MEVYSKSKLTMLSKRIELLEVSLGLTVNHRGEVHMTAIDDLNAAIDNLRSTGTAENEKLAQIATNLGALSSQLQTLQQQVASGGVVTADQLEALASAAAQIAQNSTAATAGADELATPINPSPRSPGT